MALTPEQLAEIPGAALRNGAHLQDFLAERGWQLTLVEFDAERRRRGVVVRDWPRARSKRARARDVRRRQEREVARHVDEPP